MVFKQFTAKETTLILKRFLHAIGWHFINSSPL